MLCPGLASRVWRSQLQPLLSVLQPAEAAATPNTVIAVDMNSVAGDEVRLSSHVHHQEKSTEGPVDQKRHLGDT